MLFSIQLTIKGRFFIIVSLLLSAIVLYFSKQGNARGNDPVDFVACFLNSSHDDPRDIVLASKIEEAVGVIHRALTEFKNVSFSFNGGKDCTVVFHLIRYVVMKDPGRFSMIPVFRVGVGNPFTELLDFINEFEKVYGVRVHVVDKPDNGSHVVFSELLAEYCSHNNVDAVVAGMRKTDPGGKSLNHFSPTSAGWPSIIRVSPILNWSFADVWRFIILFEISYCDLYNSGYTSLGPQDRTIPNPALLVGTATVDKDMQELCGKKLDSCDYLPAFCLVDETLERASRI